MNVPIHHHRRHSTSLSRFILIVFLLLIATGGLGLWIGIRDTMNISRSIFIAKDALYQIKDDISHTRFSKIPDEIRTARSALDELTNYAHTSFLRTRNSELESLLAHAQILLNSIDELSRVGIPIARIALAGEGDTHIRALTEVDKKRILDSAIQSLPSVTGVRAALELIQYRLALIDTKRLPSAAAPIQTEMLQSIETLRRALDRIIQIVEQVPAFIGYGDEKTYLLLFQNNAEVRATGGFIGTYGIVTIRNGEIIRMETDNVYNLDDHAKSLNVSPPPPLKKYGNISKWYLRDSNWSPDFSESAKQAIWFYHAEGGTEALDGVIALTPDVISSLMRIVGDISVEDLNFNPHQFYYQLHYQVEKGYESRGIAKSERKDVIRLITDELLKRFSALKMTEWAQIDGVLRARLAEKSLMIYSSDPELQRTIRSAGWSGEIQGVQGDFIMVVDSNIVSLKTDAVMDKRISYTITEHDKHEMRALLELSYQNNGRYSWTSTTYRNYLRVLIPDGSTILSSSEPLEISSEHGKLLLGSFLSVDPQKRATLVIEYRLPHTIEEQIEKGLYTLFVQKQSGVMTQFFSLSTYFRNPIQNVEPLTLSTSDLVNGRFEHSSLLQTDKRIDFHF